MTLHNLLSLDQQTMTNCILCSRKLRLRLLSVPLCLVSERSGRRKKKLENFLTTTEITFFSLLILNFCMCTANTGNFSRAAGFYRKFLGKPWWDEAKQHKITQFVCLPLVVAVSRKNTFLTVGINFSLSFWIICLKSRARWKFCASSCGRCWAPEGVKAAFSGLFVGGATRESTTQLFTYKVSLSLLTFLKPPREYFN